MDQPLKVLVVEDEDDIRRLIGIHLTKAGYEVIESDSGVDGIDAFADLQDEIGVVILDLGLPGMDGIDLCKRIRAMSDEMPILILTARLDESSHERVMNSGATDFMVKAAGGGFSGKDLLDHMDAVLGKGEQKKRFKFI